MIKQFKKYLEGCGERIVMINENRGDWSLKHNEHYYCTECKSKIKAKIEIMKEMKEFMEKFWQNCKDENTLFEIHDETDFLTKYKEINTCLKLAKEKGI